MFRGTTNVISSAIADGGFPTNMPQSHLNPTNSMPAPNSDSRPNSSTEIADGRPFRFGSTKKGNSGPQKNHQNCQKVPHLDT